MPELHEITDKWNEADSYCQFYYYWALVKYLNNMSDKVEHSINSASQSTSKLICEQNGSETENTLENNLNESTNNEMDSVVPEKLPSDVKSDNDEANVSLGDKQPTMNLDDLYLISDVLLSDDIIRSGKTHKLTGVEDQQIPKNGSKEGSANNEADKDEAQDIFDSLKGAIDKVSGLLQGAVKPKEEDKNLLYVIPPKEECVQELENLYRKIFENDSEISFQDWFHQTKAERQKFKILF